MYILPSARTSAPGGRGCSLLTLLGRSNFPLLPQTTEPQGHRKSASSSQLTWEMARRGKPGSIGKHFMRSFLAAGSCGGAARGGCRKEGLHTPLRCLSRDAAPRKCGRGDRMSGPEWMWQFPSSSWFWDVLSGTGGQMCGCVLAEGE